MAEKKTPLRMCVTCREMKEKYELYKVVCKDQIVAIDNTGKMPGRGAYICKNKTCILNAQKARRLERAFKGAECKGIYDMLLEEVGENL